MRGRVHLLGQMADATQEALAAGQKALAAGNVKLACGHFDELLRLADTDELKGEMHLSIAEATWQAGEKSLALDHYAAARRIAKAAGDVAKEGMISLGLGFALLNSGDDSDLGTAIEAMRHSKELAELQGHAPQVNFVTSLIAQAERRKDLAQRSEEEEQAAMLQAFVSSLVCRSPIMLFMKGTAMKPSCGFSKEAARKLMALEIDFDTVDIGKDAKLRDAVKQFSNWPTFPQLFVEGQLFGGADIIDEMIVEGVLLEEIGAKIKELPPPAGHQEQEAKDVPREFLEGTRVPRKVWPEPNDEFASCHGHGHDAEGNCDRWSLQIKPPNEDEDGERWRLTLDLSDSSACKTRADHGSSCSQHHHAEYSASTSSPSKTTYGIHPLATILSADRPSWLAFNPRPILAECMADHGACSEHGHGHGTSTDEEPELSEEAKQWMRDHPVRLDTRSFDSLPCRTPCVEVNFGLMNAASALQNEKLPLHLCPTHGDCNKCPERHDCKWHSNDGAVADIEDMLS